MEAPVAAFVDGNLGDVAVVDDFGSGRAGQIEGVGGRRAHEQQGGIERGDLLHGHANDVGDEAQVDGVVGGYGVGDQRRIRGDVLKTVLFRILGHDGDGQNDGDVVLGLLGQIVAPVEFPEVGVAGALHSSLNVAWTPVIGGP